MRFFLILSVLILGLMSDVTEAEAYMLIGPGLSSCGTWTTYRRAYQPGGSATSGHAQALENMQWVLGFLSGIGFVGEHDDDPLKGIDGEGVWAWIDNYCREHPIDLIS